MTVKHSARIPYRSRQTRLTTNSNGSMLSLSKSNYF